MAVGGESPPRVSYVLTELEDMDGVFLPIKTASRVKYTCFDVSRHYIAFGTTAGGVVLLQQDTLAYLKTLAVKEGPVCQVAVSPDESMVGFSTSRGVTIVMEHNADRGTTPPQRLQLSYEHKASLVTGLQWNALSSKLFISDDKGKVSLISVTTSRTRNIFQIPTATLVKLDSKVVQLDYAQDHLLVSTMSRCYLCNTSREQFMQIGKKLRDGEYGACFYPGMRSNDPCTIYSARPGSRMWEVDIKGEVKCTHQFKAALAIPPEKVLSFRREVNMEDRVTEAKPQATIFNKMILVWPTSEDLPFVLTWSGNAVYIFSPKRLEVVLWTEELKGVKDIKCQRGDIYIHFQDGKFGRYSLMTIERAVCRLYQHGLAIHGAQLLLLKQASLCAARLNVQVPAAFLLDMLQKVSDLGKTYLFTGLSAVFGRLGLSPDKLSQSSRSSSAMSEPIKLGTGMYVVNRLGRDLDETTSICLSRWRSASPVFRHSSSSPHSSPSRHGGSPIRRRSGTPPSVKFRDTRDKLGSDNTPDSMDSGASGKTSISDETYSSPSGKEAFVGLQPSSEQMKISPELPLRGSGITESKECAVNGIQTPSPQKSICGSESPKKISLNLRDISKESHSNVKKVSFDTRTHEKLYMNGDDRTAVSQMNYSNHISNGFDNRNNELEVGEEATCDMYHQSLYEESYSYMNMSLYGMMVPNVDWSVLFGADKDFMTIKESLANKLTSGKNLLKRGLEHLKQSQGVKSDLLDVRPKSIDGDTTVPSQTTESEYNVSEKTDKNIWSFLPLLDYSDFLELTKLTMAKLKDPEVLFSSEQMNASLEEWINSLHASQKTAVAAINSYCQSSCSLGSHSCREDDTIKSTCSQVTSTSSSPSENGEPSLRLETDEASVLSESKSYEDDRLLESMSSLNTEISDSSTIKTESLCKMLSADDFVFVHDPLRLSKEDHRMVSELVMSCFQNKVWGNIRCLKDVTITLQKSKGESMDRIAEEEKESKVSESNGLMNGAIENGQEKSGYPPPLDFQRSSTPKQFPAIELTIPSPPNTLRENLSSDNLPSIPSHLDSLSRHQTETDAFPVLFIQNYFHFMDLNRLRELLIVKNEPCLSVWSIMLRGAALLHSKDDFTQKISSGQLDAAANMLERNYSGPVLVSHLLRLFRAKPSRTIELCLHRSYHVTPLDVMYLSKACNMPTEFTSYVTNIIESLPDLQKTKVLDKLLHLDEVRFEWISSTLQSENNALLKCRCGWPRPGSHLHEWKHSSLLFHTVTTAVNLHEKLVSLCYNFGYWKGYLWVSKNLNLCDNVRQAVVHLGDASLLSESTIGYFPSNLEEWRQLLLSVKAMNMSQETLQCISCGDKHSTKTSFKSNFDSSLSWDVSLTWESVCRAAFSQLGSLQLLPLLKNMNIPSGALSSSFYQAIILSHMMNKQQSALSHKMQTAIGAHLWSRKATCYSPEAQQLLEAEKLRSESETDKTEPIASQAKCYLEEPEGHWGRKLCLKGVCELCKLPLTSHLSLPASGITVCACGHIYHTTCLPESVCMACIKVET